MMSIKDWIEFRRQTALWLEVDTSWRRVPYPHTVEGCLDWIAAGRPILVRTLHVNHYG